MMVCRIVSRSSDEVKALATSWKILNSYDWRSWPFAGIGMHKPDRRDYLEFVKSKLNSHIGAEQGSLNCRVLGIHLILTAFRRGMTQKDCLEGFAFPV